MAPLKSNAGIPAISPLPSAHTELSDDMVYEILVRLPVKTLSRLRCVCKQWNSLISHPSFQIDHHHRLSPLLLVAQNEFNSNDLVNHVHFSTYSADQGQLINGFSKSVPPVLYSYELIQSCRGLVCLRCQKLDSHILVCNPSTHEIIVLPTPQSRVLREQAGFGYAASSREFKVVRFYMNDPLNSRAVLTEILTLGSSQGWREAPNPPFYPRSGAPFLHGALHLIPTEGRIVQDSDYIAIFDTETEKYRRGIPLPEFYFSEGRDVFVQLSEVSGSLCLTFDLLGTKQAAEVWILKDYHTGDWVRYYSIDLSSLDPESNPFAFPLAIKADGSLLYYIDSKVESKLCCHSSKGFCFNQKVNKLIQKRHSIVSVVPYVESFFSL